MILSQVSVHHSSQPYTSLPFSFPLISLFSMRPCFFSKLNLSLTTAPLTPHLECSVYKESLCLPTQASNGRQSFLGSSLDSVPVSVTGVIKGQVGREKGTEGCGYSCFKLPVLCTQRQRKASRKSCRIKRM